VIGSACGPAPSFAAPGVVFCVDATNRVEMTSSAPAASFVTTAVAPADFVSGDKPDDGADDVRRPISPQPCSRPA